MSAVDSELLEVTEDDVVTLTLNRPEKLNALNEQLINDLEAFLQQLNDNPSKPLLITGSGESTCAGVDLDFVSELETTHTDVHEQIRNIFDLIRLYPLPSALAGTGSVVGAGLIFALNCDFAVLAEDSTFMFPEIKHDLTSPPTLNILANIVGDRMAKEIVLVGDPLPPERAYEIGLVNEVVPANEAEERAKKLLRHTMSHDTETVKSSIRILNERDSEMFWLRDEADL